jgi:hypothetical protein
MVAMKQEKSATATLSIQADFEKEQSNIRALPQHSGGGACYLVERATDTALEQRGLSLATR